MKFCRRGGHRPIINKLDYTGSFCLHSMQTVCYIVPKIILTLLLFPYFEVPFYSHTKITDPSECGGQINFSFQVFHNVGAEFTTDPLAGIEFVRHGKYFSALKAINRCFFPGIRFFFLQNEIVYVNLVSVDFRARFLE